MLISAQLAGLTPEWLAKVNLESFYAKIYPKSPLYKAMVTDARITGPAKRSV